MAYENTYKMPIVVVHTMNVFGERQLPSKFIPKVLNSVLEGKEVCSKTFYILRSSNFYKCF